MCGGTTAIINTTVYYTHQIMIRLTVHTSDEQCRLAGPALHNQLCMGRAHILSCGNVHHCSEQSQALTLAVSSFGELQTASCGTAGGRTFETSHPRSVLLLLGR